MRISYLNSMLFLLVFVIAGCAQPKNATPPQLSPTSTRPLLEPTAVQEASDIDHPSTASTATIFVPSPTATFAHQLATETATIVHVTAQILSTPTILATQTTIFSPPAKATSIDEQATAKTPDPVSDIRYMFPIQPAHVASYNPEHHTYPATDIFAPCGSHFVAVTSGTIDELSRVDDWDPATNDPAQRGGKYVSLIGDDGVRYYGSHLEEVVERLEPGINVEAGTIMGYVGNSGNARGIACHVHFGISPPTYPGDWEMRRGLIWPYDYLQAWKQGESIGPEISGLVP